MTKSRFSGLIVVMIVLLIAGAILLWQQRQSSSPPSSRTTSPPGALQPSDKEIASATHGAATPQGSAVADKTRSSNQTSPGQSESISIERLMPKTGGNITDLSREEIEEARDTFSKERAMWAKFKSLEGDLSITLLNEQGKEEAGCEGHIQLSEKRVQPDHKTMASAPFRYGLSITGKDNAWTFTSDGTEGGTKLARNQGSEGSRGLDILLGKELLEVITLPKYLLLPAYADDLYPQGRLKRENFFAIFQPWHNREAGDAPRSYVFKNPLREESAISFENGHLSYWHKRNPGESEAKLALSSYVESNGFWFPSEITYQIGTGSKKVQLRFKNIRINQP